MPPIPLHVPYNNPPFVRPLIEKHIKQFGRTIVRVVPTHLDPRAMPYMYSVGNRAENLPELLFYGSAQENVGQLMNTISEALKQHAITGFPDGLRIRVKPSGHPVKLLRVGNHVRKHLTLQATTFWGSEWSYQVMQIVLPDPQGLYVGDPGCQEPYASMIVWKDPT